MIWSNDRKFPDQWQITEMIRQYIISWLSLNKHLVKIRHATATTKNFLELIPRSLDFDGYCWLSESVINWLSSKYNYWTHVNKHVSKIELQQFYMIFLMWPSSSQRKTIVQKHKYCDQIWTKSKEEKPYYGVHKAIADTDGQMDDTSSLFLILRKRSGERINN